MEKIRVAVLFGGVSSEHEVSRLSVTSVLRQMNPEKYETLPVGIDRQGRWYRYEGPLDAIADGGWEREKRTPCLLSPDRGHSGLLLLMPEGGVRTETVDVLFPVLHGKNGEDGTVQGLAALAGIPCVGCGIAASANCMDKETAKTLFTAAGVPNARWITLEKDADRTGLADRVLRELGFPVFVKPARAGSSVGVSRAEDAAALDRALDVAFAEDDKVLIEETLSGAEVECAVMGAGAGAFASDVLGEIVPKRGLYDYEGKYLDGSTDLYVPARIPGAQAQKIRELAVRAYRALGCAGLARVDFFACRDGETVYLNEINTMPGFTSISMYPRLMMASGMTYPEIIDRLIAMALAG